MVYVFENGLRKVKPYRFVYQTNVKPRWVGKTLVEVYVAEFGEKAEVIEHDIATKHIYVLSNYGKKGGPIKLEGLDVLRTRPIDRFDMIYNNKHMHEPSVPHHRLRVVYQSDELLVVDKVSGIPTHPTSNYYYNSITEICKQELGLENVWPCHRLDKVTSGILLLSKTKETGIYYSDIISKKKQDVNKEYIARCVGRFPEEEVMVNCPIFSVNSTGGYIKPLNADSLPVNSTTIFRRLKYNPELNESIVLCKPLTGRMHQIRIHLRNMGHPIANDYIYHPVMPSMPNHEINVLNSIIETELYRRLFLHHPEYGKFRTVDKSVVANHDHIDLYAITNWQSDPELQHKAATLRDMRQTMLQTLKSRHSEQCPECRRDLFDTNKDMTGSGIWLHAFRYSYPESERVFDFQTPYPEWCDI